MPFAKKVTGLVIARNRRCGKSPTTTPSAAAAKKNSATRTQKPVECMRRPIVNNSSAGQAVYDPFVGSGTTMIAAEMEGAAGALP